VGSHNVKPFVGALLGALACTVTLGAASQVFVDLKDRARGAERIVRGQVMSVSPIFTRNEFGDQLIISTVRVVVGETLKGQPASTVDVDVEGGTIGEVTLRVSDMPEVVPGQRAVFLLKRDGRGRTVPYLRGQGILELDDRDNVKGTAWRLDDVRRAAAEARAAQ
jgi:hypothetical protein